MMCARRAAALAVLALVAVPGAAAHAYLAASTPSANGTLDVGAGVAALRFTERMDQDHTGARLVDGQGDEVDVRVTFPSQRPYEMRILFAPLDDGQYTLQWHALGIDGHLATGRLRFAVGEGGVSDPIAAHAYDAQTTDAADERLEAVGRGLFMAGTLVILGLPVFVSEIAQVRNLPRRVPGVTFGAAVVAAVGGLIGMAVLARLVDGGLPVVLSTMAGRYLAGKLALIALAAAAATVAVLRPENRRGWALASILPAFLATVMHSMGGHGLLGLDAGEGVAGHVGMTLHLAVAGMWIGGLVGFILLLPGRDGEEAADLIGAFSPLALVSVVVLAATGLHQAYTHFEPGAQGGAYLRLLFWKAGLLVALTGFGAWHLYWLRPRLARRTTRARVLHKSLRAELVLLAAVFGVAGLLAAVPVPSVPPDADDGPLAVPESEGRLGDYTARVAWMRDPLRADEEQAILVALHPRTSTDVSDAVLAAEMLGPDGPHSLALKQTAPGSWNGSFLFTEAGDWTVRLHLERPTQRTQDFTFQVLGPRP